MHSSHHEFGNRSTDVKLALLAEYLPAFTTALKGKFRNLIYIDAFAGTGERTERLEAADNNLFESALPERLKRRPGSARIALDTNPPFTKLVFIEKDPERCSALQALQQEYPERDIEIRNGNATDELTRLLSRKSWVGTRCVLLLDPFGMSVPWSTLENIRETEAIDVWYLVSLSGLFRQAARDPKAISASQRAAITRMVGTDVWESDWYKATEDLDLFSGFQSGAERAADVNAIEQWFAQRLKTLFPLVTKPMRLRNDQNVSMFSFFFLASNQRAVALAGRIANHILKVGSSSQVRPR